MTLNVHTKFLIQTVLLLKFQEANRNSGRSLFHPLCKDVILITRNHLQNPLVCLDSKEDAHFQKAIVLSREFLQAEELKYLITSLVTFLKEFPSSITLHIDRLSWYYMTLFALSNFYNQMISQFLFYRPYLLIPL